MALTVELVDRTTGTIRVLPTARPVRWAHAWNDHSVGQFTVPSDDVTATVLPLAAQVEVRFIENEQVRFWGRPMRAQVDTETGLLTVDCVGLTSYFAERHLGEARDDSYGDNLSFESGLTGWGLDGSPSPLLTASIVTTDAVHGSQCVELHNPTVHPDQFLRQSAFAPSLPGLGTTVIVAAWWKVTARGAALTEPHRLLFAECNAVGGAVLATETVTLDEHVELDTWQRAELELFLPSSTDRFDVRLYCPPGHTVRWDAVRIVRPVRLNTGRVDRTQVVRTLARYAQGLVTVPHPLGTLKTDEGVGVTVVSPSGVTVARSWPVAERSNVWDLIVEECEADPQIQVWCDGDHVTGARTFYVRGSPPAVNAAGMLDQGRNVMTVRDLVVDATEGANAVVTGGSGGPAAPHGFAHSLAPWGGVLRERVDQSGGEQDPDVLRARALAVRIARSVPEWSASLVVPEDALPAVVGVGEIVPCRFDAGWWRVDGDVRIVRVERDVDGAVWLVQVTPAATVTASTVDLTGVVRRLATRVRHLEHRRDEPVRDPSVIEDLTLSGVTGGLVGPVTAVYGGRLRSALVVGSVGAQVRLLLDGATLATVTVPAAGRIVQPLDRPVVPSRSLLAIEVVAVPVSGSVTVAYRIGPG